MASFLLELFSEEIPARMQMQAADYLAGAFTQALKDAGLSHTGLRSFAAPRRIALICEDIPEVQPDSTTEKKGPKTNAPQAAIDGFLRANGLQRGALEKRMVGKDETYYAVLHRKGGPTGFILKPLVETILALFPWPKSMRWGTGEARWVRPLHSILCVFAGRTVPVEFAGVTAGNSTRGHRFLAPGPITVTAPEQYAEQLKQAYVLADAEERKASIRDAAATLAKTHGLTVKRDEGLLAEVTGLTEWPTVMIGSIDAQFMDLPPEVLISEMRAHQKYFALLDKDGVFCDKFIITSNMVTSDGGRAVVAGNERVLRARLSDGRFFWDQDRKKPLDAWAEALEGVTFHAGIGSMAQKVERMAALAVILCDYVPGANKRQAERAARLCKADLVTGMVGEFPELQGVMGRYYAMAQKEDADIADAIRDHYLPLGPDSPVPFRPISICIALADKLGTLAAMFAAGEKPTGSKDPFALRRAALGVLRIILENRLRIDLRVVLSAAADAPALPHHDGLIHELLAFFSDRLKVQMKDQGLRHDLIAAVTANGDADPVRIVARATALQDFLATEDGGNLLAAYRRAGNIVTIEEKKDKATYKGEVNTAALAQAEEKNLAAALEAAGMQSSEGLKQEDDAAAMKALAALRGPIDAFFDKVLVNVEDKALRAHRLNLLARIRITLDRIADFSLIEG